MWRTYLLVLPAIILGILVGTGLDRYINPVIFRKMVLILLVVMGIRMMFF